MAIKEFLFFRDVFLHVNTTIPVYVPTESMELYKTAPQWQDFAHIRPIANGR